MAKKTVFEGVVNGIKFDNVKEYNEYLMKLIEAGEPINASTSTHTENECGCCGCCECECTGDDEQIMMLPGAIYSDDKSYVDSYISDNAIADKQALNELGDELRDNLKGVFRKIHKMDTAALENYLLDVNKTINVIKADLKSTKKAIAIRAEAIENATKELDKLNRSLNILDLWMDNYSAIKDTINDAMTVDNAKPSNDNDEKIAKELEERLTGALEKLASCFGIDPKEFKNIKIGY